MRSLLCLALMHLGLRYTLGQIGYQLISSDGLWSFYLVGLKVKKEMTNLGSKGILSLLTDYTHTLYLFGRLQFTKNQAVCS